MLKTKTLILALVIIFGLTFFLLYSKNKSESTSNVQGNKPDVTSNSGKNIKYDGEFFTLKYSSNLETEASSVDNVFYLQTKGWITNIASEPESYRIEILTLREADSVDELIARRKANDMGALTYENASIETYEQNGFNVARVTWPGLTADYFAWGGQAEYYFYKDGKGIYLLGLGTDSTYLDEIAKSIDDK